MCFRNVCKIPLFVAQLLFNAGGIGMRKRARSTPDVADIAMASRLPRRSVARLSGELCFFGGEGAAATIRRQMSDALSMLAEEETPYGSVRQSFLCKDEKG